MTRDQAKLYIPLLQAYADGKTIQYKTNMGDWVDAPLLTWAKHPEKYRVKPHPRTFYMAHRAAGMPLVFANEESRASWLRARGYGGLWKTWEAVEIINS